MKVIERPFRNSPGLLLAAGLLFLPFAAFAGGAEKDGGEIRTITATTATSDCIGTPRTPVCAVETFLACLARRDRRLCDKAAPLGSELPGKPFSTQYRVLSVAVMREGDIPPEDEFDDEWLKPGYAAVELRHLGPSHYPCGGPCRAIYSVKPTGKAWRVTALMEILE
jgi:hypothetical protein